MFPVFIGEWALRVMDDNTFEARKTIFDTQRVAWQSMSRVAPSGTAISYGKGVVDGEGDVSEYWSHRHEAHRGWCHDFPDQQLLLLDVECDGSCKASQQNSVHYTTILYRRKEIT